MSRIKTVLFDIGGVLLTNGWDHRERDVVFSQFNIERAPFEERHPEANDLWEKDRITVWEYLDRTLFYTPRDFTPEMFLEAMKAQSLLLPDNALGILRKLAASQTVELGCLNNEARELNDYRLEKFGLRQYFQTFFASCYVGLRKPDQAIYRLALDVLQQAPSEVLFIDDRPENAAAAQEVGLQVVQYKGPGQLESALKQFDISI